MPILWAPVDAKLGEWEVVEAMLTVARTPLIDDCRCWYMRTNRWTVALLSVGDLVMARRQLLNLRQLVERHQLQGRSPD